MHSPKIVRWILLALFSFVAVGFSAPESNTGQNNQAITNGNATTLSPTHTPLPNVDEEEEQEIRRNHNFLGEPARSGAAAQTRMIIGQEVPIATQYAAPRITPQADGGYVVQPAIPTAFETRRTGMTIDGRGFEQTEIEGFIDYGSPIRTAVPLYNEEGEIIGTAIQDYPNPILQPVFITIRKE